MQLPVQAQSEMFVADWERTSGPDELIAIARKADETGFFYIAVCDHIAILRRLAPAMGTTWYDTIATLGLLAGVTSWVRLLSHVWIPAYRHPLQSAKSLATLDHLSKGRLIIGVGAGHVPEEFAGMGVDFHRRGALLDEAIDALDVALRNEFPSLKDRPGRSPTAASGPVRASSPGHRSGSAGRVRPPCGGPRGRPRPRPMACSPIRTPVGSTTRSSRSTTTWSERGTRSTAATPRACAPDSPTSWVWPRAAGPRRRSCPGATARMLRAWCHPDCERSPLRDAWETLGETGS
jgi:Luciferase-like monooxygenase